MNKRFQAIFWIGQALLYIAILILGLENGLRFYSSLDQHLLRAPELTHEQEADITLMMADLKKSPQFKWTHALLGSHLTRNDADWTQDYNSTFAQLQERIVYQQDSELMTRRSLSRTLDGKTIFDVHYTFDRQFRRKVPEPPNPKTSNIVLSGCSFTFGIGLNDRDTIQFHLAQRRPQTKIHNLGLGGSAINQQLQILDLFPERAKIPKKKKSIAVYLYIDHQLNRIACGRECLAGDNAWMMNLPRYVLKGDKVEFTGLFSQHFPWSNDWIKNFKQFEILGLWPGVMEANDQSTYKLFARLIKEYERRLKDDAGISELIVMNVFSSTDAFEHVQRELGKQGIRSVDLTYADMGRLIGRQWSIPVDGHPAPPTAFNMAWLIDRHLKKLGL
jgi:hypothetical protein